MNFYKMSFSIICTSFFLSTCYPSAKRKDKEKNTKKYIDKGFEIRTFFSNLVEKYPAIKKSNLFKRMPKREGDRTERRKKRNKHKRYKVRKQKK